MPQLKTSQIILVFAILIMTFSQSYNEAKAILHATFSVITHCSTSQIQQWNCKPCKQYQYLTDITQIENTVTHISGFIGYNNKTKSIIVAWRGTVDAKNWIEDLNFQQINFKLDSQCQNCKVHAGFYNSYVSVSGKVKNKIKELLGKHPQALIEITGHSLGGSLAQLTAVFLMRDWPTKIKEMYVYGCPRVGNGNFARYLHSKIPNLYRVVHYRDIVPHCPPMDFQYLHPPFQIFYAQNFQNHKICNQSGEDPTCSNSLSPIYNFNDHTFYWLKTDSSIC